MSGDRSKSAFFEGRWVTLSADFRGKWASPTNHCWYQSSKVIAVSCVIKISAVRHLVLSQSTRVTDRRTDGRTDRQTDGQNYDSQDRPRICSRGKNVDETWMALNTTKCNHLTPLRFKDEVTSTLTLLTMIAFSSWRTTTSPSDRITSLL